MTRPRALTALTRFGLGPRPGELTAISSDPVGYVYEQCLDPHAGLVEEELWSITELRRWYTQFRKDLVKTRRFDRNPDASDEMRAVAREVRLRRRGFTREVVSGEMGARFKKSVETDHPFIERLVLFWADHFAVKRNQGQGTRIVMGNFEREVIRRHVLGYFEDMLFASTTHPAMLIYLDNASSVGPNSRLGKRRGTTSVNENLAREVLELHTLGVGGGYTQADVIALAETLSGWVGGFDKDGLGLIFDEDVHEYGPRTILGQTYETEGAVQLEEVLPDLAKHPSTARYIATKLARHFIADDAPQALIEELTDTFLSTGGDLREMAMTLIESDLAWEGEPKKTVPPYDFIVSSLRATDAGVPDSRFLSRSASNLAQAVWMPPSPAGWPDGDNAFLGGDSMLERVDYARILADRHVRIDSVQDLARDLFGEALDPFVAEAIDRAEDQRQALVLLLMSPAFHRR
ncbi:MAG: DUF1800 domain-containing protein [Pseudomonadota bacterium]